MEWITWFKDLWWLLGALIAIFAALWRLAIRTNKSQERLEQVATNKEAIQALQHEMTGIKDDIAEIKEGVDKQGEDMAAVLNILQAMTLALSSSGCDIGSARDRFNDHLAHR